MRTMPTGSSTCRGSRRRGFSLIEIAFAIAITASAVLVVMAFFPMGIRAQNQVRFKILAATKVMEMMEWFRDGSGGGFITDASDLDKEGIMPWDSIITYRGFAPDLEVANTNLRGGLKPLPNEIAYRLESENDEIRQILDQGGYLFYCSPSYLTGFLDGSPPPQDQNWFNENRKLLIAVKGYPQQNSILYHPSVKVGPYQEWYPSPPTHVHERHQKEPHQDPQNVDDLIAANVVLDALCRDPDAAYVMSADGTFDGNQMKIGYLPYSMAFEDNDNENRPPLNDDNTKAERLARGYLLAAQWYCERVGITEADLKGLTTLGAVKIFAEPTSSSSLGNARNDDWKKVLAMRYLAHAGATLTRWYEGSKLISGVDILGSMTADEKTVSGMTGVTLAMIQGWHECSLRMAVAFANLGPYNWGAPRPLNRQVMMDHPLCQLDLWSTPISAVLPAVKINTTVEMKQWRALYPQAIRYPCVPYSWYGRLTDTNRDKCIDQRDDAESLVLPPRTLDCGTDGPISPKPDTLPSSTSVSGGWLDENDKNVPSSATGWQSALAPKANFNLAMRFEPYERCRQIVVWSVDWQSYEDFETAPSAPVDASRYPVAAPYMTLTPGKEGQWSSPWTQRNPAFRQAEAYWRSGVLFSEALHNPEHLLTYREPSIENGIRRSDQVMTISDINNFGGQIGGPTTQNNEANPLSGQCPGITQLKPASLDAVWPAKDDGTLSANRKLFVGAYGANRNGVPAGYLSGVGTSRADAPFAGRNLYTTGYVDAGVLPKSVQLRAVTVCRFNYYDGRVSGALRN